MNFRCVSRQTNKQKKKENGYFTIKRTGTFGFVGYVYKNFFCFLLFQPPLIQAIFSGANEEVKSILENTKENKQDINELGEWKFLVCFLV